MASTSAGDKKITGHLKRIIGNPVGQFIPLYNTDVSVGRTKRSDLCIQDPNVSRSHCTLNYSTDGWFITDLGGVNGTYLDGDKLTPYIPHPLKDGLGIYLGPPSEAPVAFVFIKSKVEDEDTKIDQVHLQSKKENNKKSESQSQSDQPTKKRSLKTNNHSTRSKKHAPSTSSTIPVSSQNTTDGDNSDYGNNSDVSICSLDSLRTRIKKINSERKMKHSSLNIGSVNVVSSIDTVNVASSSSAPSLKPPMHVPTFDSVPSTSSAHQINLPSASSGVSKKCLTSLKSAKANMFKELDTLFTDGSDSLPESVTVNEDSESLLNEADLTSGPNEPASNINQLKKKVAYLHEQLKQACENKQKLNELMKESRNKPEASEKLGQMVEEELICNICTEVFIKATTLGCSHTYCEYCIKEWKKKQKRCPICRELIASETRVLIMDNFIDKVVAKLDKEHQDKRKEVIAAREEAIAKAKVKKTKRKKSSGSRRNVMRAMSMARDNNPLALRQLRLNLLDEVPYHVIDISTSENQAVSEFFGHCYICGGDEHFANYCPHR